MKILNLIFKIIWEENLRKFYIIVAIINYYNFTTYKINNNSVCIYILIREYNKILVNSICSSYMNVKK